MSRAVRVAAPALAATLAVLLPLLAPGLAPDPAALAPVPLLAVLLAAPVVLGTGWAGHRAAARAVRAGAPTADVLVSAATLGALAWSVPPALVVAVSPAGAGPVLAAPLSGPVLLPGAAAVLTAVATGTGPAGGPAAAAGSRIAADRWCARLGPAVALLAVAVTGFRTGIGHPPAEAVPAGLAVLLAACPCAILAAVPTAARAAARAGGPAVRLPLPAARAGGWWDPVGWTTAGTGTGTRTTRAAGPGSAVADRVDTVVLAGPDVLTGTAAGTGTVAVHPAAGTDPDRVLRLAASVAGGVAPGSDLGPFARAVRAEARRAGGDPPDVAEPDEQPGLGVSGLVAELVPARPGGRAGAGPGAAGAPTASTVAAAPAATVVAHAVLLGSPAWLLEHDVGLPPEVSRARERAEEQGRAVLAVAWDGAARAILTLPRAPHPDAARGIEALRSTGAEPVLLTPDDDVAARALGTAAGLDPGDPDAVRSGLDAAGRAAAVAGLQVRGRTVAVAADPRTDRAALAGADLPVELTPWGSTDGDGDGDGDRGTGADRGTGDGGPTGDRPPAVAGNPAGADPVPGVLAVRGGPGEVAAALVLARRARRAAVTALWTGVVLTGAGVPAAAAGLLPAPVAATVPVAATAVVAAVVRRSLRAPARGSG